MAEEKTEETKPSFLEEVKSEREKLEKVRDEIRSEREMIEKIKGEQIMSGSTDAGQVPPVKKKLTPREYADAVSKGQLPKED